MKTRLFVFAGITAMLFTCQNMQAQIGYGVHAAGNLNTQAELGQLWNNCEIYQGFTIGGFLEYGVGKNLSLQTEINYQKKGEKINMTVEGIKSVTRREFNYISVPLLLRFSYPGAVSDDKIDISFFGGPYAGFLTSAYSKIKAGDISTPVDIDKQAEKADAGAILGGGIKYRLENGGAVLVELRYEMGLTKIDKQDSDLRNKGIGLTIGYMF